MIKRKFDNYIRIFFTVFLSTLLILLPDMLKHDGYFIFYGDYALQQIPFNYHVSQLIRDGQTGWDWMTDLGTDLTGSYSFYLFGSIFFWILSLLPARIIILAMPLMLAFKTGIAAVTSYAYISRYVKKEISAFFGALMYSFSGFQMFNVVYFHFHDVTALFPLLLLAFDSLVKEKRKCCFALVTAVMAFTNYFFFFGQVVFVLLYFTVCCIKKEIKFSWKMLGLIAFESLIGVSMAAVLLVPTFMFVSSGSRVSDILSGNDILSYSDNSIVPRIIQSAFLIQDIPSSGKLIVSELNENNWASVSLYLPVFTVTGVSVYLKKYRKNVISTVLTICVIAAVIPVLNSAFYMFNTSYYARWFYMPVLFMCIATAICIDEGEDLLYGIKIQGIALIILCIISLLPKKIPVDAQDLTVVMDRNYEPQKEMKLFAMSETPVIFWQSIAFSVVFLLVLYVYDTDFRNNEKKLEKFSWILLLLIVITNMLYVKDCSAVLKKYDYKEQALEYIPELNDDEEFFRIHELKGMSTNFNYMWGLLPCTSFHSIVSRESEDFYYNVQGRKRMMNGQYTEDDYPVFGLLSVKYIFNRSTGDDLNVENYPAHINGFDLFNKQGYYYIYENQHFVPMGFMYDYCIDKDALENYLDDNVSDEDRYQYKKLIMMRALVLDEEGKNKYSQYISDIPMDMLDNLDENTYAEDCSERSLQSCSDFEYDSGGYRADISTEKNGLVFFSVPCSDGWRATVNGKSVAPIKAHYGLTAVPVDKGDNHIEFAYETPGLKTGCVISAVSVSFFALYSFYLLCKRKTRSEDSL